MLADSRAARTAPPFAGTAYYASAEPVLDAEDMVTTEGNRWSQVGEPTVYLAGDPSLALAELARHAASDRAPKGIVWTVDVRLDATVDLRDPDSLPAGAEQPPRWLDHDWCHDIAGRLRTAGGCDAMLVPSVAMLDRPDRWNLVVFVDRLRRPLTDALVIQATAVAIRPAPTEAIPAG